MASLGVNEIGGSNRLGLGKNLKVPQHDLSYFYRRYGKCFYLRGVFDQYGALIGAP